MALVGVVHLAGPTQITLEHPKDIQLPLGKVGILQPENGRAWTRILVLYRIRVRLLWVRTIEQKERFPDFRKKNLDFIFLHVFL